MAHPPEAPRRPKVLEHFGDTRVDEWYWLADRRDPAVLVHLEAELAYAEDRLAPLEPLAGQIYEEIVARIEETDLSVPVHDGPYWYYRRTRKGASYAIHCRRPYGAGGVPPVPVDAPDPLEEVVLDENELAAGNDSFSLGILSVSPDHTLSAAGVDENGHERLTLQLRRLDDRRAPVEVVPDVSYGLAWSTDSSWVFYTRADEAMRPFQVWRHRVGTPSTHDSLVLQEDDERFHLGLANSKDRTLVIVSLDSASTTELWSLAAAEPTARPALVHPRTVGVECALEHLPGTGGEPGRLFLLTNEDAEDFCVRWAPDPGPGALPAWRTLVAHRRGRRIQELDVLAAHVVLAERIEGEARVRVVPLDAPDPLAASWLVPAASRPSTTDLGATPDLHSDELRVLSTSLTEPPTVSDCALGTGDVTVRKRQPVHGYRADDYRTLRMWADAPDGTAVPLSVVARAELFDPGHEAPRLRAPAPCLLYGYGAYEHSVDPAFSVARLSLLDRGFVFAIAHVRGGGELGRHWYEDGRLEHKANTFSDFVACARHLVEVGFTSPDQLVARGASAGGLLIGAVANMAPDLFGALVAEVPFVDCLTTMLDPSLPLTAIEWEEWGNPLGDPAAYHRMKAYSPYDNVTGPGLGGPEVTYPSLFVTAGLEDPRVGYWEPTKWVAKLRAANPLNRVLLKTELASGHRGQTGRYAASWRDEAQVLAFILDAVGRAD